MLICWGLFAQGTPVPSEAGHTEKNPCPEMMMGYSEAGREALLPNGVKNHPLPAKS
jgi:hypothetical protein